MVHESTVFQYTDLASLMDPNYKLEDIESCMHSAVSSAQTVTVLPKCLSGPTKVGKFREFRNTLPPLSTLLLHM